MQNSVDPDEMAYYVPSHQHLHCLHRYLVLIIRMITEQTNEPKRQQQKFHLGRINSKIVGNRDGLGRNSFKHKHEILYDTYI